MFISAKTGFICCILWYATSQHAIYRLFLGCSFETCLNWGYVVGVLGIVQHLPLQQLVVWSGGSFLVEFLFCFWWGCLLFLFLVNFPDDRSLSIFCWSCQNWLVVCNFWDILWCSRCNWLGGSNFWDERIMLIFWLCVCLFLVDFLGDRKRLIFGCNDQNYLVVIVIMVSTKRRGCLWCQFSRVVGWFGLVDIICHGQKGQQRRFISSR